MCGIFLAFSKKKYINKKICNFSIKDLFNRGPDSLKFNYFFNDKLFIANTILSITGKLKKNPNLNVSKNNNYYVSFNGEIYNYKDLNDQYFKNKYTNDTEVLVNLHEKLNFNKIPLLLNGMFAYAILNKNKKIIKIVTDAQGEKNIYYFNDKNYFIVSSTIKSIVSFLKSSKIKIELDEEVLKNYFTTRHYMPIKKTCFKNIKILENSQILKFDLSNLNINISKYDDPLNWISENKYNEYSNITENELIEKLDFELNKQAKIMIPNKKFGTIFSGGIDSSLQSAILAKHGDPSIYLNINHIKKDKINRKFSLFKKFIDNKKIRIKNINSKIYENFTYKCNKILLSPLFTHDLPSRMYLSEEFKKNNCKVFFSADGCDELLGGQQIYLSSFKKIKIKKNYSPYTSTDNSYFLRNFKMSNNYKKLLDDIWKKSYENYSFIKDKREQSIMSSLFCDYFIQSVYVANKSTDLICCDNSVEPRNIFIQKNILKIFINLPLKYKINMGAEHGLKQKYILKKLFMKYFDKKLILKKEGFSGFPEVFYKKYNDLSNIIPRDSIRIKNKNYYDVKRYKRDLSWKISNLALFINNKYI